MSDPTDWIDLPGGIFWMGGGARSVENPRHRVRLGPFRLARSPVTRAAYQVFVDATGHPVPPFWDEPAFGHPRMPAVGPSWDDAVAYCGWVRELRGQPVRLPTEAEWEYAAKADRDVIYPWGNAPPESLPDYAARWLEGPEPVDAYPSCHPLGFLGLGENVHEWCADWYDADYYAASPPDTTVTNPQGPSHGKRRASRGGAWRHKVKVCGCTHRSSIPPHLRYSDYGFRLAADPCLEALDTTER